MLNKLYRIGAGMAWIFFPFIIMIGVMILEIKSSILVFSFYFLIYIIAIYIAIHNSKKRNTTTPKTHLDAQVKGGAEQHSPPFHRILVTETEARSN